LGVEYVFVSRIIDAIGLISAGGGKKALGFAVGEERTVPFFAKHQVNVVATDLPPNDPQVAGWGGTHQHMSGAVEAMPRYGHVTKKQMREYVTQEWLDMNQMEKSDVWKTQLGSFDFVWSVCSVEHVGSIKLALEAMINSLQFLKLGGTAVHTTEFNLNQLVDTMDGPGTVIFRQSDAESLRACALRKGYEMPEICYDPGDGPIDMTVDLPPYHHDNHLKLFLDNKYISTCIGWSFRKPLSWQDNGASCEDIFRDRVEWSRENGLFAKWPVDEIVAAPVSYTAITQLDLPWIAGMMVLMISGLCVIFARRLCWPRVKSSLDPLSAV